MAAERPQPPGFVHVDLDGLWTLAACYGFPEGEIFKHDPVFEAGIERLLGLLDELGLRATFFICGRNLGDPAKRERVAEIHRRGHELANHAWSHRIDLEALGDAAIEEEIEGTSRAIEALVGVRPLGFRAPGYAAGPRVLAALARRGIRYDGSNLPTWWGPLLRWMGGRLADAARRETGGEPTRREAGVESGLAGSGGRQYSGTGSMEPEWRIDADGRRGVLCLPLAVSPVLRLPIHASLGIMLGARAVRSALRRLARRGRPVTYMIHGMDVLGPPDYDRYLPEALRRSRGFRHPAEERMAFLREVLGELRRVTAVELTRDWIERQ